MHTRAQHADIIESLRRGGLLRDPAAARLTPLTGGVSSDIYQVTDGERCVVVKRALAKLRVAADWPASVGRNASEARYLDMVGALMPGRVPRVLLHDAQRGFFAMEYFPAETYPVWKAELRAGCVDVTFAATVGRDMAAIHAKTAGDRAIAAAFPTDTDFHALRLAPYLEATAVRHPQVAPVLLRLSKDTLNQHRALVHGDISPKNILVGPQGPVFLDAECAWYGDPAFDLAFCLNHLLLKCLWVPETAPRFLDAFAALRQGYMEGLSFEPPAELEKRAAALLPALLLARVDGKSPVEYVTREEERALVRAVALPLIEAPPDTLMDVRDRWSTQIPRGM